MNTPVIIIIPARLESTRLPRKLLLAETGKPLICHTWMNAKQSGYGVWVATDSNEIMGAMLMSEWPVPICITTGPHPNGTSRMAEAFGEYFDKCRGNPWENAIVVNVQADEPEIDPALINAVVAGLQSHPEWDCATAAQYKLPGWVPDWNDRNKVKAVIANDGAAGDFCRTFYGGDNVWEVRPHIGIYAYRAAALLKYAEAGPCEREVTESLEQLRALHIGLKMGVVLWDGPHHAGIDTRADYDAFVDRYKRAVWHKSDDMC